ncbi:YopX family protein [Streptococcus oralis]|uniref:YopX family protein n=1 Tax=Streptococcus oralis TaxID=1303 RepID=UPI003F629705
MTPKFRAYDSGSLSRMYQSDEVMVGDGNIWIIDEDSVAGEWIVNNDIHLMQSTGLVDKEGTEVFEGDILHHQIQTEYTFIVKYDKDKGRWYGDGLSRTYRIDITKEFLPYYKIIGNIYENPEFLEDANETL